MRARLVLDRELRLQGDKDMPIYEYRCNDCHQVFEEWSKHIEEEKDGTVHSCPICRGRSERLISQTSFVLNGSGWYATDYGTLKKPAESTPVPEENKSCASCTPPPVAS